MDDWTKELVEAMLEPLTDYTPGPWAVGEMATATAIRSIPVSAGPWMMVGRAETSISSMVDWYCPARHLEPNARLIAAAPDLVDALRAVAAERDAALARAEKAEAGVARLREALTPDNIAQIIRVADGRHSLGAGALGEAICAALAQEPGQ